jgi:hypothetical protein
VVGKNTHLARLGGDVDLDDLLGLVDGLDAGINNQLVERGLWSANSRSCLVEWATVVLSFGSCSIGPSYLMRERQAQLDLFTLLELLAAPRASGGKRALSETASA